jgi:hypothetical protein
MEDTNLFSNGARLVRRHLRIVIWIFVVNLIVAWFSAGPVRTSISPILDHSMASRRLVDEFDLGTWIELIREPAVSLRSFGASSFHFSLIFLLYMIFINGGVLTVYREDRKLTKAEFFEMSGAYFWRIVRLVLISFIPFAILGALFSSLSGWSDTLTNDAANARTGFWVLLGGGIVLWIAFLFVRAWFDLAQSMTVARNDRGMLRNTWRSLVLSIRKGGGLLITYIGIHVLGIAASVAVCVAFVYIPHARFRLSFVVLEMVVVIDIVVRLWQKAACMTWWETRPAIVAPPIFERGLETVTPTPAPVVPAPEQI